MILKTSILAFILGVAWLKDVSGASFSKVFVQSGPEVVPLEYVQYEYGAPSVSLAGPHIAQLSAAPVGSVVPVSSVPNIVTPCGTPCVYPGQSVAAIAPPSPNYITYKSNVPVVVQNNEEPAPGYEYSYFVFDENTGDHKAQQELSDGSVVRGAYSLIQPDGYVREVQYIADDINGFNAIVKNFLPVTVEKKIEQNEKKPPAPPCIETKNEPLKESANFAELITEVHNDKPSEEIRIEAPTEESVEASNEKSQESVSKETPEKSSEESNESSSAESPEKLIEEVTNEKPSEESQSEKLSEALTDVTTESHEKVSTEESEEAPQEEQTEKAVGEVQETKPTDKVESPDEHTEAAGPELLETSAGPELAEANILVPYNDILKCVQAAVSGVNAVPASQKPVSPLTYIVLNKPC